MKHLNIYNPSEQTKRELIDNFIIRINEFEKIYNVIKTDVMKNAPQHFIIQGVRGSGKTTLLLRIYYEIIENENLNKWLIPIRFNEEQYGISKLYKLWENIAKELENTDDTYLGLLDEMQKSIDNENYEEHCYNILFLKLKENKKKIVVFIDNIGDRLEKFTKKEQQRLREVLITNNNIRLIGSSSVVLESTYNYKEAFYDFFKIINLNELKKEETKTFLLQLDKDNEHNTIKEIIKNQPGRIEALRILTGGVPRTMVLLYQIFIKDNNGDSFHNLEILLDGVTPLYKHRMDDLSSQQQEIVDVIALNWDAIPVKEIVRKTRIESKAVSSQLNLLEKNNIIIKKSTSTKNNFYQLKERFFNIWYLMRNGRNSDKSKIKWLVKFLEIWCDSGDLEYMIKSHINKLRSEKLYDKYAYHISEAYARLASSADLQKELLDESKKYLTSIGSEFSRELSEPDVDYLNTIIVELIKNNEYQKAINKLLTKESNTGIYEITIAEIYDNYIKDYKKAEKYYLMAIEKDNLSAMFNLAILYNTELNDNKKAEKYYLMAVEKDNSDAMFNLALLYDIDYKNYKKAEKYYLMAVEKGDSSAMNNLAYLYKTEYKDYEKAEKYCLLAIEKGDRNAMFNLALLYTIDLKDFIKAEKYFIMAIEHGHSAAMFNLALLYEIEFKDFENAKKYYLMAIDKDHVGAMFNMALLFYAENKDFKNAEKYYLMAVEKGHSMAMNNLALLYLSEFKDFSKAEKYFLMAIDNNQFDAFNNLALLYATKLNDYKKAEKYFLMAVDKNDSSAMSNLAFLYKTAFKDNHKAEEYYLKAIKNGNFEAMNNLAFLYFQLKINKEKALNYSLVANKEGYNVFHKHTYAITLLWNNNVQEANAISKLVFENEEFVNENIEDVKLLLTMLIAKKQYSFAYKLFEENKFNLKDRYKPIYYALMSFMKETYPDELNKMGEELKDVVDAIIKEINQASIDYA